MARRIYFNGKFYGGALNGVHRVADRLLREVDRLAAAGRLPPDWDLRLLLPARPGWAPPFRHLRAMPQRLGHSQLWEQAILPAVARDGLLVSLANLAPALHPAKVTMVHDAQFRISPRSYPARLRHGYRLLVPLGARTSRRVLTVSDYARDHLAMFGIARADRTAVIHNAADHMADVSPDPAALARFGLAPRGYALLFGSVAAYKNVGTALAAFGDPQAAGVVPVVIGPSRATLAAAGIAAPGTARFTGAIDDAALRALYEGALCLLFPSRTEGFGLPPLEAMACGCPAIVAPAGAMPEVCRDAALYAGLDDPADWAGRIAALAASPALFARKQAMGRARAAEFSWGRAGERLVAEIAGALGERQAPRFFGERGDGGGMAFGREQGGEIGAAPRV